MSKCLTGSDILDAIQFDLLIVALVFTVLGFVLGMHVMYDHFKPKGKGE